VPIPPFAGVRRRNRRRASKPDPIQHIFPAHLHPCVAPRENGRSQALDCQSPPLCLGKCAPRPCANLAASLSRLSSSISPIQLIPTPFNHLVSCPSRASAHCFLGGGGTRLPRHAALRPGLARRTLPRQPRAASATAPPKKWHRRRCVPRPPATPPPRAMPICSLQSCTTRIAGTKKWRRDRRRCWPLPKPLHPRALRNGCRCQRLNHRGYRGTTDAW
jgi:hypothetical protein